MSHCRRPETFQLTDMGGVGGGGGGGGGEKGGGEKERGEGARGEGGVEDAGVRRPRLSGIDEPDKNYEVGGGTRLMFHL